MNKIKMHLDEAPYRAIERGEKTVEYRVNDEKRRELCVGDVIEFWLRDGGVNDPEHTEHFERSIVGLKTFDTFAEMFAAFPPHDGVTDLSAFYSKDEEKKHGVVAIELE